MMPLKRFFQRIIVDFRQKELLPLKLIFFVQASTLYVLYPYLTIHMRELGINVEETAIMSAITPFIAMVMPPLAGMFADRIGNFKILLSLFSSFGGLAALLLLLVPIGRVTVEYPGRVAMVLDCSLRDRMIYTMNENYPCETKIQPEISTRLESCGYTCRIETDNETDVRSILSSRGYTITQYDLIRFRNVSQDFAIERKDMPSPEEEEEDVRELRKLSNNEHFKTSVQRLPGQNYFFPANQLERFFCKMSDVTNETYPAATVCGFKSLRLSEGDVSETINHSYKSRIEGAASSKGDPAVYSVEKIAWSGKQYQEAVCTDPSVDEQRVFLSLPLFNDSTSQEPYKTLNAENCQKRCIVSAPRKEMCSNMHTVIEYNISLTFWLYLVIRVFIGIIGGTTFAMFEGAVIAILREQKADYGLQRIYGSIGGMISSPLSGMLIDYASIGKGYTDFRPAFYLYAGLKLVSGILMLAINLEFKSPASNVIQDVFTVLRNIEAAALFIACFILGTAWGYIESFLFWLIQDLGGSRSLMGITITVGGIAGIPLLVLSGPIISKIGHANVLFIGFVFYAIRLFGYSMIYNPWYTLIFEALESVTLSLSFTAAVTYAAKLSTTTTDSSIQGLLGGVYYGVGKGSGSLIGGYLMKAFGTRPTYRIFAVVTLITGLIYFIFNVTYLRKRPQVEGNDIVKKKPKKTENQNGLESGMIEIGLEEKKNEKKQLDEAAKENPTDQEANKMKNSPVGKAGFDNQAFTNEQADARIVEMNNARNQDKAENITEDEAAAKKRLGLRKLKRDPTDEPRDRGTDYSQQNGQPASTGTVTGDQDQERCNVTVERQPDDKK